MQQHFFGTPWAIAGDKTAIPTAQQADGSASYAQGFGPDYEKELGVDPDAKPVPRDVSNQLYFDVTEALGALQAQGAPEYITSADNGGSPFAYPRGAIVRFGSPGLTYISRTASNITAPSVGGNASWAPFVFEVATQAEAVQGMRDDVIVTPLKVAQAIAASSVSVPAATESTAGIAAIATQAETNGVTNDSKFITPLKLGAAVTQLVPTATTTTAGRIRVASDAEFNTGLNNNAAVSPAQTATKLSKSGTDQAINVGTLGTAVGSLTALDFAGSSADNDRLKVMLQRPIVGPGWTTARWRLERNVNGVIQGYIDFSGSAEGQAMAFGAGNLKTGFFTTAGNWTFAGSATANGGFQNGSSLTVKDHLSSLDAEECLAHVLALRPARYRYKGQPAARLGYYAEEVREQLPEAVTDADAESFSPLLLEDAQMLPDHTGAIQALAARLDAALARIEELENAQRIS